MTATTVAAPTAAQADEPATETMLGARQREVRTQLRDVLRDHVAARAAEWDLTHEFAGPSYQAIATAGLAGLLFPTDLGGTADNAVTYAVAVEEIAAVCPATSLIYMTQMHAAHPIQLTGTAEQQRRWIPALCDGTAYGSLAITEPEAGSDMASMRTTARRDGEHYVLSGSKTFITSGDKADVIVLFATVDKSQGRRGITAFVLPGDVPGLERGRPLHKMGMHGSSTAELFLSDVRLPLSARLGAEGGAWALSTGSVTKSRLSAAAQGVGIARAAYLAAARHLHRNGPPPDDIAARLAHLRARVLSLRTVLYASAAAIDASDGSTDISATVSSMKLLCTDGGVEVASAAADLLGPYGDLHAMRVEQFLRDSKVTQIYDGTNEIQRLIISRANARLFQEAGA